MWTGTWCHCAVDKNLRVQCWTVCPVSEIHSRNFTDVRNWEGRRGRTQWIGIEGKRGMVKYFLRVPHEESERFYQMHTRCEIKGRRGSSHLKERKLDQQKGKSKEREGRMDPVDETRFYPSFFFAFPFLPFCSPLRPPFFSSLKNDRVKLFSVTDVQEYEKGGRKIYRRKEKWFWVWNKRRGQRMRQAASFLTRSQDRTMSIVHPQLLPFLLSLYLSSRWFQKKPVPETRRRRLPSNK